MISKFFYMFCRAKNLTQINDLLKDQMDQLQVTNATLNSEVQRLTRQLERMERREEESKIKENVSNSTLIV